MSSTALITAADVSKAFVPDHSLRGLLRHNTPADAGRSFACRDINLTLHAGQVLGIVGRNGSGKSTLLRLLAGITTPSSGTVKRRGRVCSLIELTPGYDLQASGRANARLGAALQGLSDTEIDQVLPAIEAFADIGAKFDQPMRTYSSGMVARVAFATIVHCNPDALMIDEVLAVGDEAFQRKCFARLRELVDAGCGVAFVSHSAQLVTELCDSAVLLEGGYITCSGAPRDVINRYYQSMSPSGDRASAAILQPEEDAAFDPSLVSSAVSYEHRGACISAVRLLNPAGQQVNQLHHGNTYHLRYRIEVQQSVSQIEPACLIKTSAGVELAGMIAATDQLQWLENGTHIDVDLPFVCLFTPGTYFCNVGVRGSLDGEFDYLHRILDVLMFKVLPDQSATFTGLVDVRTPQAAQAVVVNPDE